MQNSLGMLFAGLYALTAVFAVFFAIEEHRRKARPIYPILLILLGITLWLFGFQHASGIFSGVTQMGREVARADHWYSQRREIQALIIGTIPALGVLAVSVLLWLARHEWRRYVPVVFAVTYLACLGALQSVSLHDIDWLMRKRIVGIRVSAWGDIGGLLITSLALIWLARTHTSPGKIKSQ
jgi:hypothetical protein